MFRTITRILWVAAPPLAILAALFYAVWGWTMWWTMTILPPGTSLNIDFAAFWGAAKLSLTGDWLVPFDTAALTEVRNQVPGIEDTELFWLYPPGYLWIIRPLGLLEFKIAWVAFAGATWVLFAGAVFSFFGMGRDWRSRALLAAVVLSPASIIVIGLGQNTHLFLAALLFGLAALRAGRPALAGACLALLSLKPQLALALPVALIAAGHWRVIAWGLGWAFAGVAATLVHPGPAYWIEMFDTIATFSEVSANSGLIFIGVTAASTVRSLELDSLATPVTLLHSVAAIVVVWRAWRTPDLPLELRVAALCIASLLMSPYVLYYEMVYVVIAMACLVRAAGPGDRGAWLVALALWYLPILASYAMPRPGFTFVAPLLLVAFGYLAWRIWTWSTQTSAAETRAGDPEAAR